MAKTANSIKKMLENKEYDKLLVIELEIERIKPDRDPGTLIGQMVLLYDLIPQTDFNTMLITETELKDYFTKFLRQEKDKDVEGTLKYLHFWGFPKFKKDQAWYYSINSKHKLNLLDEETSQKAHNVKQEEED